MTNTYLDVLCYRSKTLADGTSPILLRLTRNGKRKYVSLGLSTDPKFWDFNKNVPKRNCPDKAAITLYNNEIRDEQVKWMCKKIDYIKSVYNHKSFLVTQYFQEFKISDEDKKKLKELKNKSQQEA